MKGEVIDPIKRLARAVGEIKRMERVFGKIGAEAAWVRRSEREAEFVVPRHASTAASCSVPGDRSCSRLGPSSTRGVHREQ